MKCMKIIAAVAGVLAAALLVGACSSPMAGSIQTGTAASRSIAPADQRTYLIIGQTFKSEFQSYVAGTGLTPAGTSHYGEIYTGTIDQGDDSNNQAYLAWVAATYPNAVCEVAISIKDNPAAGGYGNLATTPNCVWKALVDIAAGKWNTQLDRFAATFKAYPSVKFLVRLDYEVSMGIHANKSTMSWLAVMNKYNAQGINILQHPELASEIDLTAYKNAFNFMANRLRNVDSVRNADFVYHPVRGYGDCTNLYPGDQYVDWIGFSVFNNDVAMDCLEANGSVTTNGTGILDSNLQQCLTWASAKKPIMICESAFQTPSAGQNASTFQDYLSRVFNLIETYNVKAFVYINSNWTAHNWSLPWGDSRVEINSTVKNYWLSKVNTSRYINYSGPVVSSTPTAAPVASPTPTPKGSPTPTPVAGISIPGIVASTAGSLANGASASWKVTCAQTAKFKALITSTSSQNSQLIKVGFGTESVTLAIDAGATVTAYFNNQYSGSQTLTVTAQSGSVSLGSVTMQTW